MVRIKVNFRQMELRTKFSSIRLFAAMGHGNISDQCALDVSVYISGKKTEANHKNIQW